MNKQQTEMKEYMSQAFKIDIRLKSKLQQIEELNALAQKATSTLDGMPKSGTRKIQGMEDTIAALVDMENELSKEINELLYIKSDIAGIIKAVNKLDYKILLECRYLNYMSWAMISDQMGYDLRWVYRLHLRALDAAYKTRHHRPV